MGSTGVHRRNLPGHWTHLTGGLGHGRIQKRHRARLWAGVGPAPGRGAGWVRGLVFRPRRVEVERGGGKMSGAAPRMVMVETLYRVWGLRQNCYTIKTFAGLFYDTIYGKITA